MCACFFKLLVRGEGAQKIPEKFDILPLVWSALGPLPLWHDAILYIICQTGFELMFHIYKKLFNAISLFTR